MIGMLIPGEVLPRDCNYCPLSGYGSLEECSLLDRTIYDDERREDCPLIQVKATGRLIDADELFKEMDRKGWYDNADRDIAKDLVLDAATIVPAKRS